MLVYEIPVGLLDQEPRGFRVAGKVTNFLISTLVLGMVPNVRNWTTGRHLVVSVARGGHFLIAPIGNVKAYNFAHFSKLGWRSKTNFI